MHIVNIIKKHRYIRKSLLYLYHKFHNRHLVKFWYSSCISRKCRFEGKNMICRNSCFIGNMGYGSYIGGNSNICADIGRFTSIAPGCKYIYETHPLKSPFVTTSPYFYSLDKGKNPEHETFANKQYIEEFIFFDKARGIINKIGSDCWIGANVTLIGGVEISDGAVILANATVTKNIPPFAIAGGIPAKIIGYRYDENTIKLLLKHKWWENDVEWFRNHSDLLVSMDKYIEYIKHNSDAD